MLHKPPISLHNRLPHLSFGHLSIVLIGRSFEHDPFPIDSKRLFLHNIPVYIPSLLTEIHSHLHKALAIQRIRYQISFLVNLFQCFFRTAIQLELKYINSILCLYHSIGTTTGATNFRLDKLSQQSKHHIKMA